VAHAAVPSAVVARICWVPASVAAAAVRAVVDLAEAAVEEEVVVVAVRAAPVPIRRCPQAYFAAAHGAAAAVVAREAPAFALDRRARGQFAREACEAAEHRS